MHPINIAIGGFHRGPAVADLHGLLPDLEWALGAAETVVAEVSRFEFPDFTRRYECVSLRDPDEYPMNQGRVVSSSGLDVAVADY